jgi:hypothetical protein
VDQKAVTKAHLWPYLMRVQKRISKNPESLAWVILDERWRVLADHAREVLAKFASGRAGMRWEKLAAREVMKLANDVPARTVVEVTTAMVLMSEMEPARFKSDTAFWLQLARRVRSVTYVNYDERWEESEAVLPGAVAKGFPAPRAVVGEDAGRSWAVHGSGGEGRESAA